MSTPSGSTRPGGSSRSTGPLIGGRSDEPDLLDSPGPAKSVRGFQPRSPYPSRCDVSVMLEQALVAIIRPQSRDGVEKTMRRRSSAKVSPPAGVIEAHASFFEFFLRRASCFVASRHVRRSDAPRAPKARYDDGLLVTRVATLAVTETGDAEPFALGCGQAPSGPGGCVPVRVGFDALVDVWSWNGGPDHRPLYIRVSLGIMPAGMAPAVFEVYSNLRDDVD